MQADIKAQLRIAVDLDLGKFFDNVQHDSRLVYPSERSSSFAASKSLQFNSAFRVIFLLGSCACRATLGDCLAMVKVSCR